MADNIDVTPGTGKTVAADDIAGVLYQRVKVSLGADGAAADLAPGQATMANSMPVTVASNQTAIPTSLATAPALVASEAHIGEVGAYSDVVDVTLSLDTSAYANGDVLADTQAVSTAVRVNAGKIALHSIVVLDEDAQGAALDLVFLRTNVALGTENSAPSITDANMRECLGVVEVLSTMYKTINGTKIATLTNVGLVVEAGAASTTLYIAAITRGTPTHTASGIVLKLGFLAG